MIQSSLELDHAQEIIDSLFDFRDCRSTLQLSVSFLEEYRELLFDPSAHLLVLVQDPALTQEKGKQSVLVGDTFIREGFVNGLE